MNLPTYRAKKIDSDEYVEGSLIDLNIYNKYKIVELKNISGNDENGIQKTNNWLDITHIIDISTLSIHFEDMIDSEGNKIFASLSEDGRGGTELYYSFGGNNYKGLCIFKYTKVILKDGAFINYFDYCHNLKVIGIKE